jgi:hypothetical protein
MKCNCGWMCLSVLALVGAAGVATSLRAQPQDKKNMPAGMPPMTAAQQKCMELGMPGNEHKRLANLVGTWNADVNCWMDEKATEPMHSSGTATYKTIWEGRFIQGEFKGDMGGMPFTGMETLGYNRASNKFECNWIDSMGTAQMFQTGTASADGKTCTLWSEMVSPIEPDAKLATIKVKTVITHTDNDHFTMEMFGTEPGKAEHRMMKIDYSRAGK